MSNISALMDASQTYHIGSGGVEASKIIVHDQATWDALTDPKEFSIKRDPSGKLWTYKGIPLALEPDPSKVGDFTFLP